MAPNTDSNVSFAKKTLAFPIFAAEFDPYNRGYLVVGGGGGEGRSGIPNQISVLDVSNRTTIDSVLDIELSRSEDSAVSLATLGTKDGLVILSGINSSQQDQDAGKNEHFRSFDVRYPARKRQRTGEADTEAQGSYQALGRRSLFTPSASEKNETYQRLLRLSPAQKKDTASKRIGAVATGLAKTSEIVVFNATNPTPDPKDILSRIGLNAEASDLDISEPAASEFSLAYCLDHDVYEQAFQYNFDRKSTQKVPNGPRRIWTIPSPEANASAKLKSKARCLRFLNSNNLVVLCNKPAQGGAELRIIHLYPTGPGAELASMSLPKRIKQATALDVCALDRDKQGQQQFVIAVAGQDISIEVYTTNFQPKTETFSPLKKYITLKNVHNHQMTRVCFAPFHPPPSAATASGNGKARSLPSIETQYIQLASTSYGNTVVVDTFPVTRADPLDKSSRFVLRTDDAWFKWALMLIATLVVVVIAFLIQSFRGGFSDVGQGGVFKVLPEHMREFLDLPAAAAYGAKRVSFVDSVTSVVAESVPTHIPDRSRLRSLLKMPPTASRDGSQHERSKSRAVVIRATSASSLDRESNGDDLDISAHPDEEAYKAQDRDAKHWDELQDHEKARWRERLIRAGEWAEEEGEKVLLGVLFSEYAGLIGQAAQEVIREL